MSINPTIAATLAAIRAQDHRALLILADESEFLGIEAANALILASGENWCITQVDRIATTIIDGGGGMVGCVLTHSDEMVGLRATTVLDIDSTHAMRIAARAALARAGRNGVWIDGSVFR